MRSDPPVRRPRIARVASRTASVPLITALLFIGTAVFARMVDTRANWALSELALPSLGTKTLAAPVPLPLPRPATAAEFVPHGAPVLLAAERQVAPHGWGLAQPSSPASPALTSEPERFSGSALVLDLYDGRAARNRGDNMGLWQEPSPSEVGPARAETRSDPTGDAIAAANGIAPQASAGTGNERFAQRVNAKQADVAQAQQLQNLHRLVPQGAIVGAVMETALNSDLPGYARALVTTDVLSFDGSAVLIPAGSRVIGEYNSGVAQGASRVFIVWSRLIRPDGVSISLGSPAIDELGRGGLGGKVNRHFLQRFGGAILLSVLTGGIQAGASAVGGGSTVVVNSSSEATSLVSQASRNTDIAPTIKTNQGTLVRIFVARDLDFTAVGPTRP